MLYSGLFILVFGALALLAISRARGPDLELEGEFAADSPLSIAELRPALEHPINWPSWIRGNTRAEVVNGLGYPYGIKDQVIAPGALVSLEFKGGDPQKGEKNFVLVFQVQNYLAGAQELTLELALVQDPSLQIEPALRSLQWRLRIYPSPGGSGSRITGTALGRTAHWRTRLWGSIIPRTIMKTFFFPDLVRLGGLSRPLAPDGSPAILK